MSPSPQATRGAGESGGQQGFDGVRVGAGQHRGAIDSLDHDSGDLPSAHYAGERFGRGPLGPDVGAEGQQ